MRALAFLPLLLPALATAQEEPKPEPINPDRPGIADGSQVVGPKIFQLEFGIQRETHPGERDTLVPGLFRYGVSRRFELRFETSGLLDFANAEGGNQTGYQPFSLGGKLQLRDAKGSKAPSVGLIARVFPPSGSASFAQDKVQGDLRLAADWTAGRLSFNPNVGVAFYENDRGKDYGTILGALTIGYNTTSRIQVFVDAGLQAPEASGKTQLILDAGFQWLLSKDLQFDFSVGQGVSGDAAPRPFVGVGLSLRFR